MSRFSLVWLVIALAGPVLAAQLTLVLPLNRTAYQTNERIDLSVVRSDAQPLAAGVLRLTVTGDDAGALTFGFPVDAVAVAGADARTTEHLHLNGWLLRPGHYTVQVASDGATAQTSITLFSHIRKSTYRTLHWWGPGGQAMAPEGENGIGFNLIYGGTDEPSIRAGEDLMGLDLMGGGHQFDLKMTNDWSDPNVYIGAVQRGMNRAFAFRTMPNAIGAHLYDEPGLTYGAGHNGEFGPWDIPTQRNAYKFAFNKEQMWHDEVKPNDPANMAQWQQTTDFRLGFMDAFWKASNDALRRLKPGYLVATQSQYGWWALFDGYYFNVARSLPVISGHGGYDDYGERNFNPALYVEAALPRQMDKPTWYLGDWGVYSNAQIREEHYLAFSIGIQGIAGGPNMNANSVGLAAGVETNKAMARLGTIFAKPDYTRQDVAILYAKSDLTHATRSKDYLSTRDAIGKLYTATRMLQYPITCVLEEDILDGSAATHAKVILMSDIQYLDPTVIAGLQAYMRAGGHVLMTDDCTVDVPGAEKIGFRYTTPPKERGPKAYAFPEVIANAQPLADALKPKLEKIGLAPAFGTTAPEIAPGRQVRGDIEYTFAINFTTTDKAPGWAKPNGTATNNDWASDAHLGDPCAVVSTITLPDDGRPVYDAMRGGALPFAKKGKALSAPLRFGPGQMYVFARTPRPIGGVQVLTPTITRDFTRESEPLLVNVSALLTDVQNKVITGTAPFEITVTDPLGAVRYDIYRAGEDGTCHCALPLAANDPTGIWTVAVKELLNNTVGKATFPYVPAPSCGAVAGKSHRAVFFPYDKENIYHLFRDQRAVTLVTGDVPYAQAAAEHLQAALKPYNVTCTIVSAKEAGVARPLSDEEAATWCGMYASGSLSPDQRKNPQLVGYNLPGPSVLLGSPKDNPLIQHLTIAAQNNASVLPYHITADFPGRGHGYLAWNYATLGHDLETVACIGTDAAGLDEAVGTLFQLAIGLDPLTPLALPVENSVTPATRNTTLPALPIAWQATAPDSVQTLTLDGANLTAYSWDGTLTTLNAKGKVVATKVDVPAPKADKPSKDMSKLPKDVLIKDLAVKQVVPGPDGTAVVYWGGTVQVILADGTLRAQQLLPQDITALAWDGDLLVAGLAGGDIVALSTK